MPEIKIMATWAETRNGAYGVIRLDGVNHRVS